MQLEAMGLNRFEVPNFFSSQFPIDYIAITAATIYIFT